MEVNAKAEAARTKTVREVKILIAALVAIFVILSALSLSSEMRAPYLKMCRYHQENLVLAGVAGCAIALIARAPPYRLLGLKAIWPLPLWSAD